MVELTLSIASRTSIASTRLLAGCALAALALSGCSGDDPFEPTLAVVEETLEVFAINGSDPGLPNAMALITTTGTGRLAPLAFRATPSFFFDLAVDLDETGKATLYPMLLVGSVLGGTHEVGLRPYTIPFEELRTAPTDGYVFGEAFEISEGDVFAAVAVQAPICRSGLYLIPNVYGKLRVDSIDPVKRSVTFTVVADPSCGFRRLTPPTTN